MLESLTLEEAKHVAYLAKAVRAARDRALAGLPESEIGEPEPARGVHNPAAAIGMEPLPPDQPTRTALRDAIAGLPARGRAELLALTWIAQGDYAAKDWDDAVAAAATVATVELLADQADLHERLMKGLYEMNLMG